MQRNRRSARPDGPLRGPGSPRQARSPAPPTTTWTSPAPGGPAARARAALSAGGWRRKAVEFVGKPGFGHKKRSDPQTWSRLTGQTPWRAAARLGATPAPRPHGRVGPALPLAGGLRGRAADHRRLRGAAGPRPRLSRVTGRVDRLLIAAGLSYVEALRTRQGFKSPPGAADNDRKRLSLLPRTLRPRRLVPDTGFLRPGTPRHARRPAALVGRACHRAVV
jgi:hypothetical protein